jgi:hypothetical protein
MTIEDIEAKFNALSSKLLKPDRQKKIKGMIFACENMKAGDFMAGLVA